MPQYRLPAEFTPGLGAPISDDERDARTAPGLIGDAVRAAVAGMRAFGTPRAEPPPLPVPPDPSAWPRFKVPLPQARPFGNAQVGQLMKRARGLLRSGELGHRAFVLLDCLLLSCRRPGQDLAEVGYRDLRNLARMANGTVSDCLTQLIELELIERIKRRVTEPWHQGGQRSRQIKNCYRLLPPPQPDAATAAKHSESSQQRAYKETEILYLLRGKEGPPEADSEAREALEKILKRREAERAAEWQAKQAAKRAAGLFAAG